MRGERRVSSLRRLPLTNSRCFVRTPTRVEIFYAAREEGLREGEIDLIADRSMWKRGFFPIRMRPVKSLHEFRAREFGSAVPFTASEEAFFLSTGPCSGSTASANSVVSVKRI